MVPAMIAQPTPTWRCDVVAEADPQQRVSLIMAAYQPGEHKLTARIDPSTAIVQCQENGLEQPSPAALQVLKSEMTAGILAACRDQKMPDGLSIELQELRGWQGETATIATLPSIAFAVAASLIASHVIGREDMLNAPRGGHGCAVPNLLPCIRIRSREPLAGSQRFC